MQIIYANDHIHFSTDIIISYIIEQYNFSKFYYNNISKYFLNLSKVDYFLLVFFKLYSFKFIFCFKALALIFVINISMLFDVMLLNSSISVEFILTSKTLQTRKVLRKENREEKWNERKFGGKK